MIRCTCLCKITKFWRFLIKITFLCFKRSVRVVLNTMYIFISYYINAYKINKIFIILSYNNSTILKQYRSLHRFILFFEKLQWNILGGYDETPMAEIFRVASRKKGRSCLQFWYYMEWQLGSRVFQVSYINFIWIREFLQIDFNLR